MAKKAAVTTMTTTMIIVTGTSIPATAKTPAGDPTISHGYVMKYSRRRQEGRGRMPSEF